MPNNGQLRDMIHRRRSVRKYTGQLVDADTLVKIEAFCADAQPLIPGIQTRARIVSAEQVRFYMPWKTPQLIAIFSENKPGYLENVGFIFQQVDLYLQSLGLGSCWLGLGKLRGAELHEEGMEFVILMAFGSPEGAVLRGGAADFHRRSMNEITDTPDERLEPARLAPSSTNSQPWYFTHDGETIHAYRSEKGLSRHTKLGNMNRVDMGIALAHLYVAHPNTFRFFHAPTPPQQKHYQYSGSFTL